MIGDRSLPVFVLLCFNNETGSKSISSKQKQKKTRRMVMIKMTLSKVMLTAALFCSHKHSILCHICRFILGIYRTVLPKILVAINLLTFFFPYLVHPFLHTLQNLSVYLNVIAFKVT